MSCHMLMREAFETFFLIAAYKSTQCLASGIRSILDSAGLKSEIVGPDCCE